MPDKQRKNRKTTRAVAVIISAVVIIVIGVSAAGGALAGQNERDNRATQTTDATIIIQFELASQNLEEGKYDLAVQRFLWIQERNPDYPGLSELLAQAQSLAFSADQITTSLQSPGDPAARLDQLFADASQRFEAQDWERVIDYLDELIEFDSTYKKAEVNEMLFNALKTLGLGYIRGERLEEGIYLLGRAEAIGALDDISKGEIYLANLYLTAMSYWNISWPVTISNLEAVLEVAPNYKDAREKLISAHTLFGDQLMALRAFCDAESQYTAAFDLKGGPELEEKLTQANTFCLNPELAATETPGAEASLTPPDGTAISATTTAQPTDSYSGIPTEEP